MPWYAPGPGQWPHWAAADSALEHSFQSMGWVETDGTIPTPGVPVDPAAARLVRAINGKLADITGGITLAPADIGALDQAAGDGRYRPRFNKTGAPYYDVAAFAPNPGAFVPGVDANADTAAAKACLDAIAAGTAYGARRMVFGPGDWKINPNVLQVNFRGLIVEGHAGARTDTMGGTRLFLTGPGVLFQMGVDNGRPYDDATDYSGIADYYVFRDVAFDVLNPTTALENGSGNNYTPGTYAVRDWRGGDALFERCRWEHFDFCFWGVQSDQNRWRECRYLYNHSGMWFGPLCDQQSFFDIETWGNDTLFTFDAASNARFFGGNLVGNGTLTNNPYKITSNYATYGSSDISFFSTWFEHHQFVTPLEAMVEIGVGATSTCSGTTFYNCHYVTQPSGAGQVHAQHFAKIGNADRITVDGINVSAPFDNFIKFVGTTSPRVRITAVSNITDTYLTTNAGTGTPEIDRWSWGNGIQVSAGRDVVTWAVKGVAGQTSDLAKFKDGNGNDKVRIDPNGRMAVQRDLIVNGIGTTGTFTGSGFGVLGIQEVITVPTTNPVGGGVLYVEGGVLKYRGPNGATTTIAPA